MTAFWWILLCYMIGLPFSLIGEGDYLLAFSFYLNGILFAYMSWTSLLKKDYGPAYATVNIFLLLFFYVAPIYQIIEYRETLINNYNPPFSQMILANIFIFLFTAIFLIVYKRRIAVVHKPLLKISDEKIQGAFPILVLLSVFAAAWAFETMRTSAVTIDDDAAMVGDILITIRHKVAFVVPFATLGFYLCRKNMKRSLIVIGFLILLTLMTKNILMDRRNALGPVYLSILFLLVWKNRISSGSVFVLVGSALLFVFPITAIFINNPIDSWGDLLNFENISREIRGHFVDMHYDAWANVVAAIQFVETEGLQLGRQLLGALLFFFPRGMWADKPISSGQMLGDYLVLNHGLWFTNISFPFPAEGFVDFGVVGVLFYAMALGGYSQRLDYFVNRGGAVDRTSALYFSFYLTFVMRGAFLPAFAYGVGAYIAMNVIPMLLTRFQLRSRYTAVPPALTGPANSAIGRP
ncbi:hypothetical protein [Sphingomonas sp. KR3-1]|uniref:hypothetical protein n=1 Tax=Sphingomonas sp. KR3-1 TaxID=3156611 RepID=UPI0032B47DA8